MAEENANIQQQIDTNLNPEAEATTGTGNEQEVSIESLLAENARLKVESGRNKAALDKALKNNGELTKQLRAKMTAAIEAGFTDSFRYFHPDAEGAYSWWSYRMRARERNAGWRIDYFMVSDRFAGRMEDAKILSDIYGSDHCPVELDLK